MQPFDINPTAPPSKPNWFNRKPMRHKPADYSQPGAYFITICTRDKECIFGRVTNGTMHLNDFGSIAQAVWHQLPTHFPWAETDAWIVMPNHVHGIIWIHGESTPAPPDPHNQQSDSSPQTLGVIVGTYKSEQFGDTHPRTAAPPQPPPPSPTPVGATHWVALTSNPQSPRPSHHPHPRPHLEFPITSPLASPPLPRSPRIPNHLAPRITPKTIRGHPPPHRHPRESTITSLPHITPKIIRGRSPPPHCPPLKTPIPHKPPRQSPQPDLRTSCVLRLQRPSQTGAHDATLRN